jgi:alpha-beta hydrolase superfamily lysophospholipase
MTGLVVSVLLVSLFFICTAPRVLSRLITEPLRRPAEVERQQQCWQEFELLGATVTHWGAQVNSEKGNIRQLVRHDAKRWGELHSIVAWHVNPPEIIAAGRPLVVILHGFSDSSASMKPIAAALAEAGHPLLMIDMPGQGLTHHQTCTYGKKETAAVADFIRSFLSRESERVEKIPQPELVVLGFSMGGAIALRVADSLKGSANLVGVMAGAPFWNLRTTMHRFAGAAFGIRSRYLVERVIAHAERNADFQCEKESLDAIIGLESAREDASSAAPALLVLVGENDPLQTPDTLAGLLEAWPGSSKLELVLGAAHSGLVRSPGVTEKTKTWLDELLLERN